MTTKEMRAQFNAASQNFVSKYPKAAFSWKFPKGIVILHNKLNPMSHFQLNKPLEYPACELFRYQGNYMCII